MASTLLSPGVAIQERDLTLGSVETVETNVGAIVGAFQKGPVGVPTRISSESDLLNVFGQPNDSNAGTWWVASSFLSYGGVLDVVRAAGSGLLNARVGGTGVLIENEADYEGNFYFPTGANTNLWEYAAKESGTYGNSLRVATIDRGADQNLYLATPPVATITPGDLVANAAATKTAYVHAWDATTRRLSIIWATGGRWTPSANGGDSLDDGSDPDVTISSEMDWYSEQEIYPGLRWNQLAGRPGTSLYVGDRGGAFDEIHAVVYDHDGGVTGTPLTVLEKFLYGSKASDAKTTEGSANYYPGNIKNGSSYVYWGKHEDDVWDISTNAFAAGGGNLGAVSGTTFDVIGRVNYTLSAGADAYNLSDGEVLSGYDLLSDTETVAIDYLLMGDSGSSRTASLSKAARVLQIASSRKDCIGFVSAHRTDVVGVSDSMTATNNMINYFDQLQSTSYGVFDAGWKYVYDRFNDKYRWVPCNGDVAGLCAATTANGDPWFSPAGLNRGAIRNAIKLAYSPKRSERDALYQARINPVTSLPGQGIILFGDKTALASPSAFDRINVRRLFLVVEKTISNAAKGVLFELNDEFTRNNFNNVVEPFLREIQARRGVTDFLVVCDASNNTTAVIDANEFVAEIYIKPARSINFITLTFVATRSGVSFDEVVPRRV